MTFGNLKVKQQRFNLDKFLFKTIYSSDIQYKQKLTVTQHKKPMNEASRNFYLNGVMKYESKLYNFAKRLFKERLKFLGIALK